METSGDDDQTNSAGARPTGRDLQQQQEWWTQTPDDQTQEQDWWDQTHVPSREVGEQERSEHRPAPTDSSEAPEQSVQPPPPVPMQLTNTPCHCGEHSESNVPDHLWDWWNDDQQRQWLQVLPWPPALDINRITVGISGIAGMPTIGINGHLGLHVAMMMGGHRGHSGIVNRRSTSTIARLQNGTEIFLRRPRATLVAH